MEKSVSLERRGNAYPAIALFCACVAGIGGPLRAEEVHDHGAALSVLVDGSKEPERIPENLAFSHFILSVAEPDNPSAEQLERRRAVLLPVQLSTDDEAALVVAVSGVRARLDSIQADVERLSSSDALAAGRLDELRLDRNRLLEEAAMRITAALSEEGGARLAMHVRTAVRPKIVIYGTTEQ